MCERTDGDESFRPLVMGLLLLLWLAMMAVSLESRFFGIGATSQRVTLAGTVFGSLAGCCC